jgi:putative component of membrane protein insertase Oxa1/YidC/SpoIIIJ protein YidD
MIAGVIIISLGCLFIPTISTYAAAGVTVDSLSPAGAMTGILGIISIGTGVMLIAYTKDHE